MGISEEGHALSGLAALQLKLCALEIGIPANHRNPQCALRIRWDRDRNVDLFEPEKLFLANAALAEFNRNRLPDFVAGDGMEGCSGVLRG